MATSGSAPSCHVNPDNFSIVYSDSETDFESLIHYVLFTTHSG